MGEHVNGDIERLFYEVQKAVGETHQKLGDLYNHPLFWKGDRLSALSDKDFHLIQLSLKGLHDAMTWHVAMLSNLERATRKRDKIIKFPLSRTESSSQNENVS